MTLLERFVSKVNKNTPSGCWEWTGAKNPSGYGSIWENGLMQPASRISYELFIGNIPKEARVSSKCGSKSCVNPEHLGLIVWSVLDRFLSKVDKNGDNGCWIWTASKRPFGYGVMEIDYDYFLAHRVSYELFVGKIPNGLCVLHKCDNPPCVNPEHLFLGTKLDNTLDMESKNRGNHPRGERAGNSKLKQSQVDEIRIVYKRGGISQAKLAKLYSVSSSTIFNITTNQTWKEVGL